MNTPKTIVDNFLTIADLLTFNNDDDFYFVQLISRRKDNPGLKKAQILHKTWYVGSTEYLLNKKDDMIRMAEYYNARVYINLNKRNYKKVALQTARIILNDMSHGDYKHSRRAFDSACGRYISETDKSWILDVDEVGRKSNDIVTFIERECEPVGPKFKAVVNTKNGYHIIVSPFNLKKFVEEYPDIEVHKNNPTLLYLG